MSAADAFNASKLVAARADEAKNFFMMLTPKGCR
jgi:hypothetical protein